MLALLLILLPLAVKSSIYHPTSTPTGRPTMTRASQTISEICPDHFFHSDVSVDCIDVRDEPPFLQIKARSTVDYSLTYDESLPSLFIPIQPVPVLEETATFIVEQSNLALVDTLIGIALDGVPIYTALGPGNVDLVATGEYAVDNCGGSYGPTPDGVRYHYRTIPSCILNQIGASFTERTSNSTITTTQLLSNPTGNQALRQQSIEDVHELLNGFAGTLAMSGPQILGWTVVGGHPIYSPFNERGLLHDGLDNCNGKFNVNGTGYAYYATPVFPYIMACYGPGVYSLQEQHTSLEFLPSKVSNIKYSSCPGGYYSVDNGCTPCPSGRYSTTRQGPQIVGMSTACPMICPVGFYCPPGSVKPLKCPAGRFSVSRGLGTDLCDGECMQGYYCPAGSTSMAPYPCGLPSVYCPPGSPASKAVDVGYYSIPEDSGPLRHGQLPCGAGTYCTGGVRIACPAGRYGDTEQLVTSNCTAACPKGYYCPEGSVLPIPCPAGTFGEVIGLTNMSCSGVCAPGYWCPEASVSATQVACQAGSFGTEAGLGTATCNPLCEPAGAPNSTDSAGTKFCEARFCTAGYFCPAASTSATQNECGDASVFCPPSSAVPTPVSDGYYTVGPLSQPFEMQNPLDATVRTSQQQCEPGYYCIKGVKYECAPGSFGSTYGLTSSACSGLCSAGYICSAASPSSVQMPCGLGPEVYCPVGSYAAQVVPDGYYSTNGTSTTRSAISPCPKGTWCSGGVKRLCAAGRYSAFGSSTVECDGLCEAGFYCLEGSSDPKQHSCPPGRYGKLGMTSAACAGACLRGYYCPSNSTLPWQNECGGEFFYCPPGSGSPIPVSRGYYSTGGNSTTRFAQAYCDVGPYNGAPPFGDICPSTTVV